LYILESSDMKRSAKKSNEDKRIADTKCLFFEIIFCFTAILKNIILMIQES